MKYCYPDTNKWFEPQLAVRGDGAVIIAGMTNSGFPEVTIAQNGSESFPPIPASTLTNPDGTQVNSFSLTGPPIINSDGVA